MTVVWGVYVCAILVYLILIFSQIDYIAYSNKLIKFIESYYYHDGRRCFLHQLAAYVKEMN